MTTMDTTLESEGFKNWVKGGLLLKWTQWGIRSSVRKKMAEILEEVKIDDKKREKDGKSSSAGRLKGLLKKYQENSINKMEHIRSLEKMDDWDVAKCFMVKWYADKKSEEETDVSGLIDIILHCTELKKQFTEAEIKNLEGVSLPP